MAIKLRALSERDSANHPHEGQPFHMKGSALSAQFHGGPVEVTAIDPARLQRRDKGTHGTGFYTTSHPDLAKGYATRKDKTPGVVTVKNPHPDSNILVAGEHEHSSHPALVNAVKQFNPKYAKFGDVGIGDLTWRTQVNKFAEHHGYDAVRFHGQQEGSKIDHVVWKNHAKLNHAGIRESSVKEDIVTCKGCGQGVHTDDNTCHRCGTKVPPPAVKESKSVRLIPLGEMLAEGRLKLDSTHDPELAKGIKKHEITGHELGAFAHGTSAKIREFNPNLLQRRDQGFFGKGMYGSKDKEVAKQYGPKVIARELQPNAKVLRYHRVVSKNHPDFVKKVKEHASEHLINGEWGVPMGSTEHMLATRHDDHSYHPHDWDRMVKHYADHHNYDAVHIIHTSYGNPHITRGEYPETDEVRVRNLHALAGPEAQHKLPGMAHLVNYNKPKRISKHAGNTESGKPIILKKFKRKASAAHSHDAIGGLGWSYLAPVDDD